MYMSREERREQIVNAVIDIVTSEGLAAATVRRIAGVLQCSPGQIHYHFTSAEALRAEAIREVWNRLEPQLLVKLRQMPPRERLIAVLTGCSQLTGDVIDPVVVTAENLWREAWDTRREPAVKEALLEGMNKMRAEVVLAIEAGIANQVFQPDIDIENVSLILIAASQGYDMLAEIGATTTDLSDRNRFFDRLLRAEGL